MKLNEIKELTDADIESKVQELKSDLFSLRYKQKVGQLENGKQLTEVRKTIARCLTVLTERKMQETK